MHNPLRSEADAFRWVVAIGLAAASIIAVTLLTRPAIGIAWGTFLLGFGVGAAYRPLREWIAAQRGIGGAGDEPLPPPD